MVLGCWTADSRELSREKKRWTALARSRGRRSLRHITHHPVLPGLEPRHGEIVQQKTSAGAFATTGLAGLLHNMDIRDLVVCGQISYGCAGGTAIEAAGWGYVVTMVDDASTAPGDRPGHLAFLRLFQQFVGRVWSSDDVIRRLTGNPTADAPAPAPQADLTRTVSLADITGNKHEVWDHRPAPDATCLLDRGHAGAGGAVGRASRSPPFWETAAACLPRPAPPAFPCSTSTAAIGIPAGRRVPDRCLPVLPPPPRRPCCSRRRGAPSPPRALRVCFTRWVCGT